MRRVVAEFDLFAAPALPHEHARELEAIDQILSLDPGIAKLIWKDLRGEETRRVGRPGLSAEQVLRAAILKQMNGFSYQELAFHLADSRSYMRFLGFTHPLEAPRKSALADNIKRISAETWEAINRRVLAYAEAEGIEDGHKVRIDPTVVESNIHHPTDNALLFDGVRTLARLLGRARKSFGVRFHDRTQRAKRRHMEITNARRQARRVKPYKDLLRLTRETLRYAEAAVARLHRERGPLAGLAQRLADEIDHYVPLVHQLVSQTQRRVLHGESVAADQKLVSLFEPHTDIIRKDGRDTYYGHKVTLTGGASGLILDWVVEDGNPADSTLFVRMLDRQHERYGRYPTQAAADGALASKANLVAAKERGLEDVVFAKRRNLHVEDMASSTWVYRQLRNFRAGIEGMISFLKRVFGLGRCLWKGADSFASYVGVSVVSANLLLLARHLMA
ncbi:MAG: ISNCY family transposase [Gemmatimonadota bacterium]|jgi:IS5 family transposase